MVEKAKAFCLKYREIISYLIVGGLTTLVSLITYYLCVNTFCDPSNGVQLQIANVLSWIAAVAFAYYTNRRYVFRSKNANVWKESGAFFLSRISSLLVDMGLMHLLVIIWSANDKAAKLLVQVVVIVVNYVLSKLLVFRQKKQ